MATKLQIRRGTAAQWTAKNPVLAQGEPGLETDTGLRKTGDGSTAWVSLPYDGARFPLPQAQGGTGAAALATALNALTPGQIAAVLDLIASPSTPVDGRTWWLDTSGPDTTAPVVTAFVVPSTAASLTVAVTTLTATDAVGVTGYKITESATAPDAADPGWTALAPATFTCAGDGLRTLYAWAKDLAGNVSASASDTVTITLPADVTPPTVTAFTMPASYTTGPDLLVPITTFTATDDRGVTGYLVNESATPPLPGAAGWVASAPSNVTAGGVGARVFYAWAKDAAGNVSSSLSASCTVTQQANALANPGFETALAAGDWDNARANATRVAADGGVTPHGDSYMLKMNPPDAATGVCYQTITGDQYRAAPATFDAWLYSVQTIANDTDRGLYLIVIAYNSVPTELDREYVWVCGRNGYASNPNEDISQTTSLTGGAWAQKTVNIRTILDARLGGNLASVASVRIYLAATHVNGQALTAYWDDVEF